MNGKQWQSSGVIVLLLICIWGVTYASTGKVWAAPSGTTAQGPNDKVKNQKGEHEKMQKAIFGAGCFWGVEETFRHIPGVTAATVGYSGGTKKDPSYQDVCSGKTGHTEVVEVEYDPSKVSYEKLLDVFFANHDPTTPNRQGPDVGYQYRSVIFYTTPEQEAAAHLAKENANKSGRFSRAVVTAIEPAKEFYKAEEYHQHYLEKNGLRVCH